MKEKEYYTKNRKIIPRTKKIFIPAIGISILSIFLFIITFTPDAAAVDCSYCHLTYTNEISGTFHGGADRCILCHSSYTSSFPHPGTSVNETKCRDCHVQNQSGFYERHSSSSDCTTCHFANTTVLFEFNSARFKHSHNLTVEYNYYSYNLYGIPANASRTGKGMFPYYACTLACHKNYGEPLKIDEAAISWNESAHARSRHGDETYDSKNSCAKCKSPPNYNSSASSSTAI
ncbi:MAG TPA: hypothetical protein VN368_03590, partial [Candidatus Methylomirabilis sp.]|nr:hypothetical protein [Candidatus Methylomirabilis sp.]